jgi:hypothetical protein
MITTYQSLEEFLCLREALINKNAGITIELTTYKNVIVNGVVNVKVEVKHSPPHPRINYSS